MPTRTKKVKQTKEKSTLEIEPIKIKKSFDFEIADPLIPEKIDEVEATDETEETEDGESDVPSLDDEELNPFKDKWEE